MSYKRLSNGARIIYDDADNVTGAKLTIFINGGAALLYNNKTSIVKLASDVLELRLKKLARTYDLKYKSTISWDYISYVFDLGERVQKQMLSSIIEAFLRTATTNDIELAYIKKGVEQKIIWEMNRRSELYPIISFLASRQSAFSWGFYGSIEDLKSISVDEYNKFEPCYFSPNNIVLIFSGVKYRDIPFKEVQGYKPRFKDSAFKYASFIGADRSYFATSYLKANSINVVRLCLVSVPCRAASYVYDVVSRILEQDEMLNSLSDGFYVQNKCNSLIGSMEFVFYGDRMPSKDDVFKALYTSKNRVDEKMLDVAKQHLLEEYKVKSNNAAELSYIAGRAELLLGDAKRVFDYTDNIDSVSLVDVKKTLERLGSSNNAYILIRSQDL